jgi:hypothetical protein
MKLFREWVLQPNQRRGTMLPLERFKDILRAPDPGYASVYAFREEDAQVIIEAKSSAGMNRFAVQTDVLMIDLDDGDRQLRRAEAALAALGLSYTVWASGGKGYHISIPMRCACFSIDLPYSQRKWVEALDVGADLSLYQHGRVLSLPGRVHPKTGNRKTKVKDVLGGGLKLDLPLICSPAPVFAAIEGGAGDLEAGLWQLIGILGKEPEPGNRHTKIWSTAKSLADAGLSYDTALDLLTEVNNKWEHAKTLAEVTAAVQQAYRK